MAAAETGMVQGAMEDIPWYCDATLFTNTHLRRAGTLIQCVRKWASLSEAERPGAHIKLSIKVDGLHRLDADQIAVLMSRSGYLNA